MRGSKQYLGLNDGQHRWRLRVWVVDHSLPRGGRQVSETFAVKARGSGTGSKAADDRLDKMRGKTKETSEFSTDMTVTQLWERWDRFLTSTERLSPTTLRSYQSAIQSAVLPSLGHLTLADIDASTLDTFYVDQLERVGARTVGNYHRILSSMFRQAEKWKLMAVSPTRDASPPRAARLEIEPPSLDTVRALVRAAERDPLFGLLIVLAAYTGARRGELMALRWQDVDYATSSLSISRSAYKLRGDDVAIKSTKTDRPRTVSLPQAAVGALQRLAGEGFIFSDDGSSPWNPDKVTLAFRRLRNKVPGAESVRLHDLRHMHASQLIAGGMDVVTVSKRLGHSSPATTQGIYAHALEEREQAAAEMADSWGLVGVVESADTGASKALARESVRVRVPPPTLKR